MGTLDMPVSMVVVVVVVRVLATLGTLSRCTLNPIAMPLPLGQSKLTPMQAHRSTRPTPDLLKPEIIANGSTCTVQLAVIGECGTDDCRLGGCVLIELVGAGQVLPAPWRTGVPVVW
jgi:hypothetical protein